jgi:hypothetical protein
MLRSTLLRSAIGILLAAVASEVALRHLSWIGRDPLGGPGSTIVYHRLNEGWGFGHWDGAGIRASPVSNTPTLLAVGDSFTEAQEVDDDEVFTALLGLRVLNAGRASESPADYCLQGPKLLQRYRPAWTLIEINDMDLSDDAFESSKAHFVIRGRRLLAVPTDTHPLGRISRILGAVRRESALANYAVARIQMFGMSSHSPPLFRAADRAATPPPAERVREWPVDEELSAMANAYQGRVTFFFIPSFQPAQSPIERRFLMNCRAANRSCVDLRAAFGGFSAAGRAPFGFPNSRFGEGHMNAAGHRAAAMLMAAELSNVRRRGLF